MELITVVTSLTDASAFRMGRRSSSSQSSESSNQLFMGIAFSGCFEYAAGVLSNRTVRRKSRPNRARFFMYTPSAWRQESL